MNKNKVAMTLVLGAVSAIVTAPLLLEQNSKEKSKGSESTVAETDATDSSVKNIAKNELINLKDDFQVNLPEDQKLALANEVNALLKRDISTKDLKDGFSLVLTGYGKGEISLEQEVYNELALTYNSGVFDKDSTNIGNNPYPVGDQPPSSVTFCHSACHYACHGSRGWR